MVTDEVNVGFRSPMPSSSGLVGSSVPSFSGWVGSPVTPFSSLAGSSLAVSSGAAYRKKGGI